jgi:nitroreductase
MPDDAGDSTALNEPLTSYAHPSLSSAPQQPWQFVVIGDPAIKRQIRLAAEEEGRIDYLENRMNEEWQVALAPIGTDHRRSLDEVRTIVGELPTSDMAPDIATETK